MRWKGEREIGEKWGREMRGCLERVWGIVGRGGGGEREVARAGFGKGAVGGLGNGGGDVAGTGDEGWDRFSVWGYEILL